MAQTRWLTDREQRAWRAYLDATILLFDALDRQLQTDSGFPHAYYEILVRLSETPQHQMRMSELADRTKSSRSRVSHAVARLQERGWVLRMNDPTDKRGQIARLTGAGMDVLVAAAPGHVAAVRAAVIDVLTPEQVDQLCAISEAISGGLSSAAAEMGRAAHPTGGRAGGP